MRKIATCAVLLTVLGASAVLGEEPPRRTAAELMDVLMWNREPIGGPFTLVDHEGNARTDADFRGKLLLVYFGFTSCPDICPTDLQQIAQAITLLGAEGDQVQPLFVTLDPERDTAAHLAEYVANFHPRLIGLTGRAQAVRAAADSYKVFYEKIALGGSDCTIDHSASIYLMDRSGGYLGFFPPGTSTERMLTILRPNLSKD